MKIIIIITILFFSRSLSAQNTIEKTKIGKYSYNLYHKEYLEYEINKMNLTFHISLNNKEYFLGNLLSYNLDNNPNLLGLGKLKIDKKNKTIICTYRNLLKTSNEKYDSIVYINKQKNDGSFYKISIIEYQNGLKKTLKK